MDTPDKPPLVFANRVIRLFVNNVVKDGEKVIVLPDDFRALRVAFRKLGGSWEAVGSGDLDNTLLLMKLIRTWGKRPERKRKTKETGDA